MTRKKPAADAAAIDAAPADDTAITISDQPGDAPAAPAPSPAVQDAPTEPSPAPDAPADEPITRPSGGGSWLRAPDGTLTRQEG